MRAQHFPTLVALFAITVSARLLPLLSRNEAVSAGSTVFGHSSTTSQSRASSILSINPSLRSFSSMLLPKVSLMSPADSATKTHSIEPLAKPATASTTTSSTLSFSKSQSAPSSAPSLTDCSSFCTSLHFSADIVASPISCELYTANSTITIEGGQATSQCGSTIKPTVDICRITLSIATSYASQTYAEVWLPNGQSGAWNGRTMSTDNGGLNGCVHYADMQYVSGLGFAAIGDNGGHNSSAFNGTWMFHNNEEIIDWVARARHQSIAAGKQIVTQFYKQPPQYSYYIGCSTGGQQGMHSAQYYPDDFDGIIAGSPAADFNHLEDWSSRLVQFTGTGPSDARFLSYSNWLTVQEAILNQCDEPLDHVPDGILEDPTICQFNSSGLACSVGNVTGCLSDTQVVTVNNVFSALFNAQEELLFPAMLYGSEVDAWNLGQLDGSTQGIVHDFFAYGVYNDSNFNALDINQTDYDKADQLDSYHGNISSFTANLTAFHSAGGKLIIYHGLADPLISGANSQRYYQKVAKTMSLNNTQIDDFMRLFRISGMAHCGVGGISGAGAWMFGQSGAASIGVDNVVLKLVDWVERGRAPDVLVGTKFWWDEQALGIEFARPHCRFPFRTTYIGGDWNLTSAWNCTYIDNWRDCGAGALPRTCNVDGSFT